MFMNVKNVVYRTEGVRNGADRPFAGSPASILGKKGQVLEGTITKVSDRISINFNGIEVAAPRSAVRSATEGDRRKFQIMDVSKENIVLKEVGRTGGVAEAAGAGASAEADLYCYGNVSKERAQPVMEEQEAKKDLSLLTGEDMSELEDEEGAIEKYEDDSLKRALARAKEQKEWKAHCRENNEELCRKLEEGLDNIKENSFLEFKSRGRVEQIMRDAGIPVTDENFERIVSALQMSRTAGVMSDDAKAYIIGGDMQPTIENIYHGQYSGVDAAAAADCDEQEWLSLKSQIEAVVEASGLDGKTALYDARWLLANNLPVTAQNLRMIRTLDDIKENMTLDRALGQIVQTVALGGEAKDALLDDARFSVAWDVIDGFKSADDGAIAAAAALAAKSGEPLSLELIRRAARTEEAAPYETAPIPSIETDGMDERELLAVAAKRRVAEICLKMTVQSVFSMREKGIDVETAPLEKIVDELRRREDAYYAAQSGAAGETDAADLDLMREAMQKKEVIADAPASIIGRGIRQLHLITFNELHAAAASETAQKREFMEVYEKVATRADAALGDGIKKAFESSASGLLSSLGLDGCAANERAVRILGYNGMEITKENIEAAKECDFAINRIIENMKPAIVLELIRRGRNPLGESIAELDAELKEIADEKGPVPEEKYSRYLWQLEKNDEITESERDGYIGIYRLLNNIEKSDGAAIGAVLQSGRELTLGNLLSAVRTRRAGGFDARVDDAAGGLEKLVYDAKSITDQINAGFGGGSNERESGFEDGAKRYYKGVASEALDNINPAKVKEISDGDMEKLLDVSLERFAEHIKASNAGSEIKEAYFDERAAQIRELDANRKAVEDFMAAMQIPSTVENTKAALNLLENGYSPLKEAYKRRGVLDGDKRREFEETVEEMADALDDEEGIKRECEKAEKYMEDVLEKSYEAPDVSYEELAGLKMLGGGMRLGAMLVGRRSYSVPVVAGGSVVNMNVTILSGYEDKGKVRVLMEDGPDAGEFAAASMEFKLSGGNVRGIVVCPNRAGLDAAEAGADQLKDALSGAGYGVGDISFAIGAPASSWIAESGGVDVAGADLYRIAKIAVSYMRGLIEAKGMEETEVYLNED